MDDHARQLGSDGAWSFISDLQPTGWAPGRRQGGVGELSDADGAAQARPGHAAFSPDVFCGVADFAASRLPGAVPDRLNLSLPALDRSSASSKFFCRTVHAIYVSGE